MAYFLQYFEGNRRSDSSPMSASNTQTIVPYFGMYVYSVACQALPTNFRFNSSLGFVVAHQFVDF
jgi:hypothetical protein